MYYKHVSLSLVSGPESKSKSRFHIDWSAESFQIISFSFALLLVQFRFAIDFWQLFRWYMHSFVLKELLCEISLMDVILELVLYQSFGAFLLSHHNNFCFRFVVIFFWNKFSMQFSYRRKEVDHGVDLLCSRGLPCINPVKTLHTNGCTL